MKISIYISYLSHIKRNKVLTHTFQKTDRSRLVGVRGQEKGDWGMTTNEYGVSFLNDENVWEAGSDNGCI